MSTTRPPSTVVALVVSNLLACVVGGDDAAQGTDDGSTSATGNPGTNDPSGADGPSSPSSPSSNVTESDSDPDSTGDDTDDSTTGDPPVPVGTVAELLVPFDANVDDLQGPNDWGSQYGKSPEIVPLPRGADVDVLVQDYTDGPNGRAYVLRLEPSGDDYVLTAILEPAMLDRIMGLARDDDDALYVASGIDETDTLTLEDPMPGEYRSGIVRVVKQAWDGSVAFDTDLDLARQAAGGSPELLVNPMVAATSRMAWANGRVALVHGINTDTDWAIENRHQKALTTHVDASTGDVVRTSSIWVSHSFDQRLFHDGTSFLELHLGDAFPRDIAFARVEPDSQTYSLLGIKGELGWNNTYTRLGNAATIDDDPSYGFLALFATEATPTTTGDGLILGSRELAIVRVRRDFETTSGSDHIDPALPDTQNVTSSGEARENRLRWLTGYDAESGGQTHAERPKLVGFGDDTYAVLWERWDTSGFAGTWGMVIDAAGETLVAAAMLTDSHLPRGDDAFALGGEAAWITGDAAARALHLHVVDAQLGYRRIVVE